MCDCVCIYDVTKVASVMQISRYVAAFPPGPDGSVGASGTPERPRFRARSEFPAVGPVSAHPVPDLLSQ